VDTIIQAVVMGIVQGLTEFLPISSTAHLIIVPYLLGWDDPFITSLAFGVMLHLGTLAALLVYFWRDWVQVVPAWFASLRERSLGDDPNRRLAWLLLAATVPAAIAGYLLESLVATEFREIGVVAASLAVGAGLLWLVDRVTPKRLQIGSLSIPTAFGIGVLQSFALLPGVSRSGASIAGGLIAGLTREEAARFSFLMATPIIAGAGAFETLQLIRGGNDVKPELAPLVFGMLAAFVSGMLAVAFMLRWLRTHSFDVFVVYRLVAAAVVVVAFLTP
jgi:undecaprenyl-diphosphatase